MADKRFLQALAGSIEPYLFNIEGIVGPDYKITLCCRHKTNNEAHIILSVDDLGKAIEAIRHTDQIGIEVKPCS